MGKGHGRLQEGELYHCKKDCPDCSETRPAIRFYIDNEHGLEVVDRHTECGQYTFDFSVALHVPHPAARLQNKPNPYVVRGCSAHANFHFHLREFLKAMNKNDIIKEQGPLNTLQEATEAYDIAMHTVCTEGIERWWETWHK